MAQLSASSVPKFSILGDSNVHPHVNKTSCRANPQLKSAQVLQCGNLAIFPESLGKIRPESSMVIIACLTNFLTSVDGPSVVSQRVEPVIQEIRAVLLDFCSSDETRSIFLSPPMYRASPVWYREGLPEVLSLFSQTFSAEKPPNLHLLPSFPTPAFDADGVHLTPFSGLEYILHLFDSSEYLLSNLGSSLDDVAVKSIESTRVLEDRVMALEQDHRRLNRVVEDRIAVESEIADYRSNERFEDCFLIYGLTKISDDIVGKPWQEQAVRDVQEVLLILMGSELPILFIQNSTTRQKDTEIVYTVRMVNLSDSKAIRLKFGTFWLGGQDRRPEALRHINIKNRVTPETKIRISLLKLIAQRYRDTNPGSRVQVVGYDPRPLIKITPASGASDRRIKVFNFVEAVAKLPSSFSADEVEPILRRIRPELLGKVRSTFVILSDDAFRARLKKFPVRKEAPATAMADTSQTQDESDSSSAVASVHRGASGSSGSSRGRNPKRGAPPLSGPPVKK